MHEVPTVNEIDKLLGLNILPANVIENLLPSQDKIKQQLKTVMNKPHNQK